MRKFINTPVGLMVAMVVCGLLFVAAKPSSMSHLTSLWIGDNTASETVTAGENDLVVAGTAEFIGGFVAGNTTRDLPAFNMAGWVIDGGADIDEASTPTLDNADNLPSIEWDDSGEVTAIQQTFRLPSNYSGDFTLYCLISSDTDANAAVLLDWRIWVNTAGSGFDAAAIQQTAVAASATGNLSTTNEVLTLTLDTTGEAAITAGDFITVDLFNATTHASASLELKGVSGTGTVTK